MKPRPKIKTYADLSLCAHAFARREIPFLIIAGGAGTGKSRTITSCTPNAQVIAGHMSALGLYMSAYAAQDGHLVLDDIDGMHRDPNKVALLKALTQTEDVRRVTWTTASRILAEREIPTAFETCSPICIIANDWEAVDANSAAVEDRAIAVEFAPSAFEVHREVSTWFTDVEVLRFIEGLLPAAMLPSIRVYVNASKMRNWNPNWRDWVRQSLGIDERTAAVAEILADDRYGSEKERIAAFVQLGGSRATFFRLKRALQKIETLRLRANADETAWRSNTQSVCGLRAAQVGA